MSTMAPEQSPRVKALLDKRAKAWSEAQDIRARAEAETGRDLTTEEDATFTRALDDVERIDRELDQHRRAAGLDAFDGSTRAPAPSEVDGPTGEARYAEAFELWMRHGNEELDTEHRTTLRAGFVAGSELRAQGVATGGAGGYTVPPAFRQKIIEAQQYVAPMRAVAEVITTETGAEMPWPTVDDTANEGAILGENTQATEQDVEFGEGAIGSYMYTSKVVRAAFQLLNDGGFDFEAWLAKALGQRIGRVQNRHFTVGTGVNQPDGLVTSTLVGKVGAAGQVAAVTYDDLVDLSEALDPTYLTGGNVGWMFSQGFRKAVRKLKDNDGRPLWQPSIQIGSPDVLMGYGITLNNNVPAPAASAKSAVFGDFREAYLIRDVQGFQLLRLVERYADFLQVGFLGFQRSDGTLQNSGAVRAYQHPAA